MHAPWYVPFFLSYTCTCFIFGYIFNIIYGYVFNSYTCFLEQSIFIYLFGMLFMGISPIPIMGMCSRHIGVFVLGILFTGMSQVSFTGMCPRHIHALYFFGILFLGSVSNTIYLYVFKRVYYLGMSTYTGIYSSNDFKLIVPNTITDMRNWEYSIYF